LGFVVAVVEVVELEFEVVDSEFEVKVEA